MLKSLNQILLIEVLLHFKQILSTHSVVTLRTYAWWLHDLICVQVIKEVGGSSGEAVVVWAYHFVSV